MVARTTLNRLGRIAEEQWGLVTRRQAEKVARVAPATFARLASDGSILERIAHGVYHLTGAPLPDHVELRAAWLQLAPDTPAWERRPDQGIVSHRSAAALFGIGHLPADRHDFTLPKRRQSRRSDVRLHRRHVADREWVNQGGLPTTRPSRVAADLLLDREDPEAVAHLIADAIRSTHDNPRTFADALTPHAASFGLGHGDGPGLLLWLLDLVGDPETSRWMDEASAHPDSRHAEQANPGQVAR